MSPITPLPSPALQFYEGGQDDSDDSESGKKMSPVIYAQLTGFFSTGENGDGYSTSYIEHNWKQTRLMNQFFAADMKNDSREDCNGNNESSPCQPEMDEVKALKVIKQFLKATIRRRRTRARLLAIWRLVSKTSSKRSPNERRSSSFKERDSDHRPLAEMENEDDPNPETCNGKERDNRCAVQMRKKNEENKPLSRSPRSVSCINLPQLSKSFLPRRNSYDKVSRVAYCDKFSPNEADCTNMLPCSRQSHVDSLVVNITGHSDEKEPIPLKKVEVPNLDLSSYFVPASLCSDDDYVEWKPFANMETRHDANCHGDNGINNQLVEDVRDGKNFCKMLDHDSMIDLI